MFVKHFILCFQIKCGPLLHTCQIIDTGPAVSILVLSNLCDDTSSYRYQITLFKEYLPEILFTRIYLGEKFKCAIFLKKGRTHTFYIK